MPEFPGGWTAAVLCGWLLLVGSGLVAGGCGSAATTSSTSSSTTSSRTTSGASAATVVGADELSRFAQKAPSGTANVLPPSTRTSVDRAYLTAVFDDAQRVWRQEFAAAHLPYEPVRLVIFWGEIHSACGPDGSGPFYCPADRAVYLDVRFLTLLLRESQAGVAAQAYIIGHEIAHHVQRLAGISRHVDEANQADPAGNNGRTVRVELQADCLAGVWARSAFPRSEVNAGDLVEALKAAKVIGDDYLMEATGQVVDRALWTHGSSQQRQDWLRAGFRSGRPRACNTFATDNPSP